LEIVYDLGGSIGASIVHDNNFGAVWPGLQISNDGIEGLGQAAFLIERGNHDGKVQRRRIHLRWRRENRAAGGAPPKDGIISSENEFVHEARARNALMRAPQGTALGDCKNSGNRTAPGQEAISM
jgi:hypothetical protein